MFFRSNHKSTKENTRKRAVYFLPIYFLFNFVRDQPSPSHPFSFFLLVELQFIFKSAAVERGDLSQTSNLQVKSVKVGSQ